MQMKKGYIALFSCAVTRAIHLDITEDLETGTFLRCFRKFLARTCVLQLIISDNAKTFKSAAKELKTLYEHPDVQAFLTEKRITWRFSLEKAPWWLLRKDGKGSEKMSSKDAGKCTVVV